jgi:hypothetical protein
VITVNPGRADHWSKRACGSTAFNGHIDPGGKWQATDKRHRQTDLPALRSVMMRSVSCPGPFNAPELVEKRANAGGLLKRVVSQLSSEGRQRTNEHMNYAVRIAQCWVYFPEVSTIPMAASPIIAVAIQPSIFKDKGRVNLPITFLWLASSIIKHITGAAVIPLMMAAQTRVLMGSNFVKFRTSPIRVANANTE